ncbi:PaaI family thioesterase [Nocardioides speluncae]|uniref:PaaI family thioesterase n=1 Tax=Nocardioides speluncae TaxID=2670337 RepID=UPI000D68DA75|nr:PaaI family thioesterase [Nocardioides speluncae]
MTQTELRTTTRTYSWVEPGQADLVSLLDLDGLGQLEAMVKGDAPAPPIMQTLDVTGFRPERGSVTVELRAQTFHYNPLGSMHGGVISMLLDTAAGCSVHSTLAVGEMYTSLDLNVKFLRPVTVDSGLLTCVGSVIQRGRRTALAEARLTDQAGKLAAYATSSCMIFGAEG